jgi:DNA-binding transcriptional LysR family regulator
MSDVRIIVHTLLPSVLLQSVLTQQVELGVSISQEAHPNILVKPLYENPLVVALPARHPLAAKKSIHIKDLLEEPFIGYGSDTSIGRLVRKLFLDEDITLHAKVEVQQVHVACAFVDAGIGVSIIDALAAKSPIWPGMVVRPLKPQASAPVSIIHGVFSPPSRLAQEFIATLEELYPR